MGKLDVRFRVCPPQSLVPSLVLIFSVHNHSWPMEKMLPSRWLWWQFGDPQKSPCVKPTFFSSGFLFSIQRISRYVFFYLPSIGTCRRFLAL